MIVFFLIIILSLIHCLIPQKKLLTYYVFSAFLLGFLSYKYLPTVYEDLYRHLMMMDEITVGGWNFVKKTHWFKQEPVFMVYAYLVSFLKQNSYLPAITVFITYYLSFSLIYKMLKKYHIPKVVANLSYFFLLSALSLLSVMSGIRNMLAFSIFAYTLYNDLVEKKYRLLAYFIYISLLFVHASVSILLFLRLVINIKNKMFRNTLSIVLLLWGLVSDWISSILILFDNIYLINLINQKVISYSNGGSQYVYSTALIRTLSLGVLFLIIVIDLPNIKKIIPQLYDYYQYILLSMSFVVGSFFQYDIFVRTIAFLILSSPIIICPFYTTNFKTNKQHQFVAKKDARIIIYVLIFFVAIISLLFNTWSEYMKLSFDFF